MGRIVKIVCIVFVWLMIGYLVGLYNGYNSGYRDAQPRPAPEQPDTAGVVTSRVHVLAPGDSVQWGGMTGEIIQGWIVPHGRNVVLELETKGGSK